MIAVKFNFCVKRLGESAKTLRIVGCPGRDLNMGSPEYVAGVLTAHEKRSAMNHVGEKRCEGM